MSMKSVFLLFLVTSAEAALNNPRKLYREVDESSLISLYTDPIDGVDYRLPNNTKPLHYNIWLSTDIHKGEFDFEGLATIRIQALEDTREVTLHIRELTIVNVKLMRSTGGSIQSNVPFTTRDDVEFLIITPSQQLINNVEYLIEISYLGTLRDDDAGFYRSSYIDDSGEVKWLATTQFESTDARHGFPCYDEPGIRSSFSISIRHDVTYTALSNGPQESRMPDGGNYVLTKFKTIPSVQSYLIAFIVSGFAFIEDTEGLIPHRIFAKPSSIYDGEADLALTSSVIMLKEFEDYIGIPYSLDKMDQVAMPNFSAGAMENWELVTYREPYLLFNQVTGRARDRENVIATIAHEFAHQWFGNLVSPAWWNYLWLNEGFATLYENHLPSLAYPDERWIDTFLVETVQPVLETDANPNIRPMSFYVENPVRIDNLFDSVAYSKSGSVLKMFQYAFGDDTWRKGLNYYLNERAFNSGTPQDLYDNIQHALDEDVTGNDVMVDVVMSSWELQSGFPYITVSRNGEELTFEQNRFMYTNRNSENLWWVPLNYLTKSNPDYSDTRADMWLKGVKNLTIQSSSSPKPFTADDWIIVNIQQTGYYRVNYDGQLWNSIIQELHPDGNGHENIHIFNRAQLIDDSFHLARADLIDFNIFLGVIRHLEMETDYIPWASFNRANTLMNRWLSDTRTYPQYQALMRRLVEKAYNKYGVQVVDGEQRVDSYARAIIINLACQAQMESCHTDTSNLLYDTLASDTQMSPDLIASVYCSGMRSSDRPTFVLMLNRYFKSTSTLERNSIISGLGCTQDMDILNSILDYALNPYSPLTLNERSRILLSPINMGDESIRTLIYILNSRQDDLVEYNLLRSLCSNIATRIHTETNYDYFSLILNGLRTSGILTEAEVNGYLSNGRTILNWQESKLESINAFFDFLNQETTTSTTEPQTTPTQAITSTTQGTTSTPSGAGNIILSVIIMKFAILINCLL